MSGKTIFLTSGAGYIGSHSCKALDLLLPGVSQTGSTWARAGAWQEAAANG